MTQPIHPGALDAQNPWPGLMAFDESSHDFFRGRASETEELLRLVRRETVSVLFGQSGLGKTSLIQAGLFPALREEQCLPVYLRLDFTPEAPRFVDQVLARLHEACQARGVEAPPPLDGEAEPSLWGYFHRPDADFWDRRNRRLTPVLVFDQFEEVFTLGNTDADRRRRCEELLAELSCLTEHRPTLAWKNRFEAEPDLTRLFDFWRADFKVLLAFREDYLPDFEALRQDFRGILVSRMRLAPLKGAIALQAVVEAGHAVLTPEVAREIVTFVSESKATHGLPLEARPVEPALLSLFCSELNLRRQERSEAHIEADAVLRDREAILRNYYDRCLEGLSPAVGQYVEDHLVSPTGHRERPALDDALRAGVDRAALDTLVARRLLRLEEQFGVLRLELMHDSLTDVIRERREGRRESHLQQEAARHQAAQRRRMTALTAITALLAAGVVVSGWMWREANRNAELARQAQLLADVSAEGARISEQRAKLAEEIAIKRAEDAERNEKIAQIARKFANKKTIELENKERDLQEQLENLKTEKNKNLNLITLMPVEQLEIKKDDNIDMIELKKSSKEKKMQLEEIAKKINDKKQTKQNDDVDYLVDSGATQITFKGFVFNIIQELVNKYPELIKLVLHTESMDNNEKQYWFDILPSMTDEQIDRLFAILEAERKKLEDLEVKYQAEIKALNEKHLLEWFKEGAAAKVRTPAEVETVLDTLLPAHQEKKVSDADLLKVLRPIEANLREAAGREPDAYRQYIQASDALYSSLNNSGEKLAQAERTLAVARQALTAGLASPRELGGQMLNASWYRLLVGKHAEARDLCREGLALIPTMLELETNLAHAHAFLGQREEALAIYLKHLGARVGDKPWASVILEDFEALAKEGVTSPVFTEVAPSLKSAPVPPENPVKPLRERMDTLFKAYHDKKTLRGAAAQQLGEIEDALRPLALRGREGYIQFERANSNLRNLLDSPAQQVDRTRRKLAVAVAAEGQGLISRKERVDDLTNLTWQLLLARRFEEVLALSREGLVLAPNDLPLQTNLAHALALTGDANRARELYLRHKGRLVLDYTKRKTWNKTILDDFEALKKQGLGCPLFEEIRKALGAEEKGADEGREEWP